MLIFILIVNLLQAQPKVVFEKFDQLKGVWIAEYPDYKIIEKWKKISSTKFEGLSFRVDGVDTIQTEVVELLLFDDAIYYNPRVFKQNNAEVISFKMNILDDNLFRFVNLSHDFPKEIIYDILSEDKMVVKLKGSVEDSKQVSFYFNKVNK
jgi:hypothetical protein